ncbi:YlcI/YnfO family protein [Klebsiella quasipneumoniae]|uniref:YlcI/YnfO family protein n=1 Tax=Klebsiella quasipneumoniae TaxID=1463165 RepID=UPI000E2D89BB|nr:YlcI/YnfO family protein [Klebsiella quasipneumoniae]HBR1981751.1 hypothetical protein [Klebsiella quasipneumoniae subsp. quasipneumoniae]MCB3856947.1 hypothetical protein [Klebsiella quasipneumoniae]SXC97380.1 Uncharacterised protein [Klebsiella quasipneumoniae]HDG7817183.1 hypothetical protein [Klebsiella quasipneumoniae]HDH1547208.1 hypothetical protein [Klebsiella quasipneumoniae subsp. quasipneumoniae]
MATANKNTKSQLTTVRVPHDVMKEMESVKLDDESNAGFIVAAMRGEIARRKVGGSVEDTIVSTLEHLTHMKEKAIKAGKEIEEIIKLADIELNNRANSHKD